MTLSNYFNTILESAQTDKGTYHSYIQNYYTNIFSNIRNEDIKILEIGVLDGKSIKFWNDWFINAEIIGMDINTKSKPFIDANGYTVLWEDAYTKQGVSNFEDNYFDFIIDDGPHTLESQLECVRLYLPKLKKGGKIIIEEILVWKSAESKFQQLGKELGLQYEGKHIPGSRKSDNAVAIYIK